MSEEETLENPQVIVLQETEPKDENFLNSMMKTMPNRPSWFPFPLEAWYGIIIGLLAMLIVGIIFIIIYYYRKNSKKKAADRILAVISAATDATDAPKKVT